MPNSTIYVSAISFNWTVYDAVSPEMSCNLTINDAVNRTNITAYNGTMVNTSVSGFIAGITLGMSHVMIWQDGAYIARHGISQSVRW